MKTPTIEEQPAAVQQVLLSAERLLQQGVEVYFKYTCLKCGERCTFEEMAHFYHYGKCEKCGHTSDVRDPAAKLNFMAVGKGDAAMTLAENLGLLGQKEPDKE